MLRTVDGQPGLFYLLGLAAATMNDRFQRLGDLACGTMVVVEERQWYGDVVRVDDPRAIRLAADLPAGFQPSRSLARALATYVGRRKNFSPSRRAQLARHLGVPLRRILDLPPETDFDRLLCAVVSPYVHHRPGGAAGGPAGSARDGVRRVRDRQSVRPSPAAAEVSTVLECGDSRRLERRKPIGFGVA